MSTATHPTEDIEDADAWILIVEDSPTQAEQLRHLLEEHGYRVKAAATGTQALLAAHGEKPALILSDIVMPEMDGYAFCKAVKSDDQLKDVPVILMTSLSSAGDVVKGLQCGADNFIRKPYENKYLLARVNYALTNRTLRSTENVQFGVHIMLSGERHFITADRQQILDLLISTYEEAVHLNEDLKAKEQQLARSNRTLAGLYRIGKVLNRATSQEQVLEQVLDEAMELPGVQAGWFLLREGETGFRLAAARGLPPALNIPGAMESDCLCRRRLLSGELSQATNIHECEWLQKDQGDTQGLRCHASVPLWAGHQMVGVLNLLGTQEGLFRDEELQAFNGVGNQIALGLQRLTAQAKAKQLAQQLADRVEVAETKYETLMQHANDAIFVVDPAGPVLEVNRQAEAMLGRPSIDMIGHPFTDLVSPTSFHEATAHFQQLLNKGTLQADDIHLRHSDGRQVCADLSASLVPVRGQPLVLAIARDVTERNLLSRQFQQAQKMEAIGQLASGVAHDFNNLLTVILGFGEIMTEDVALADHHGKDLGEIIKAAQRAAGLTKQLLAFSRQQVLHAAPLDVNGLITGMTGMLGRLIGEHIEVALVLAPNLSLVLADRGQLEQVVMNLVVNARDAMPDGGSLTIETAGVELKDSLFHEEAIVHGQYVMIGITDTGCGMTEETQRRLFEPFFTTKEAGKGTGLGLSTTYGIVKQSEGYIRVSSEPGRGTTFNVYLPRPNEDARVQASSSGARPIHDGALPRGTETLLVVEDDPSVRDLARGVLEAQGYDVLWASNGQDALQVASEHKGLPIRLVVTDVIMPLMGGNVMAEWLQTTYSDLKILFTSGYTDATIPQHRLLQPGVAFLPKPYTPTALTRKVREMLDESD